MSLSLSLHAGHAVVAAILLDHAANIEAQSDRTKDTALSLACSGGRQEVCTPIHISAVSFPAHISSVYVHPHSVSLLVFPFLVTADIFSA